jgi:hypothetical protein
MNKLRNLRLMRWSVYFASVLLATGLSSCSKAKTCGCKLPPTPNAIYLTEYTWGLISATSIHSLSSGTLHNYIGVPADSLHFIWGIGGNVNIDAVSSFIRGNGDSTISNILSITPAGGVPESDTSAIAFDTVITATPWRANYSDTLFISKISPSMLVFQVGYSDSTGTGVEIDSFRSVGFFRPF